MQKTIKPLHLLVIEDNPYDFKLLKNYLKKSPLPANRIFHSESIKTFSTSIKKGTFDIILLTFSQPRNRDIDSLLTMKKLMPKTPIIVVSGIPDIDITVKAISAGAQDYLVKGTFDEMALARSIFCCTERNKILEKLKNSNDQLRSFFDSARDPILLIDDSFRFIDCNDAAVKILGAVSKEQILYKPPAFFSPKYQPDGQLSTIKAEQVIKVAYQKGSLQFEWIHQRMDGTLIDMDVSLTVIPTLKKKFLLVHWRDITERKKAEVTIRKLYQAVEQTDEIVIMTGTDGIITFVNDAFEDIYGYKKEEVVGKTTARILKSGAMSNQFYEELWSALTNGRSIRREVTNKTKTGRLITIDTSMSPIFNEQRKLIGFMAVQEDITEKKLAEKKLLDAELQYRTLFEKSPEGISVLDAETLLPVEFNEQSYTQLGYSKEEFARLKISDFETIDSAEVIQSRVEKIMQNGQDNFETKHKTKNGDIRDVSVIVVKITLHGKPLLYSIFRDITKKRKLEERLKQQEISRQREITEATILGQEKERNQLGRELHDNISQILASAKMFLSVVRTKKSCPTDLVSKSYELVDDAIAEIRKLSHTLVAPSLGDSSLQEVLDILIQEINSANEIKVQLTTASYNEQEPDKGKELMLYRIVQEQMNNILKYANAKQVTIDIKKCADNLVLSIADDGVGFDTSQKTKGIGLRNIQNRVEFYSGSMNLISAPGKGCQLEVSIPY